MLILSDCSELSIHDLRIKSLVYGY